MRLTDRFLVVFMLGVVFVGCTSKEKKETANASNTPTAVALKDFERPRPPVMMTDLREQAGYVITHYWDKFDFTDTMYCHAPEITEQAFSTFIYHFPFAASNKISEGVNKLMDAAEVNEVMYNYFFKTAEKYLYNPNSRMRSDEFYIPFLEHIVNSTKVLENSKISPRHLLQLAYRNRIGTKANDVVYTTESGRSGRLYAISAPYVLLIFYNPDCAECRTTIAEIKRTAAVTAAISSGRLKVLAVYPDENTEIWQKYLNDIPPSWINGYDKSLSIRNNERYDLKAIPTLYLLDENKNVILKDAFSDQLYEYLERNNIR